MRLPSKAFREQLLFAAILTIVPILLCGFMFGFDIPLASAEFWRVPKNDMIAMTSAYEAYVRQPWTFPPTMVSGLLSKPVSLVFTDSIPWLAILLKASGLGPYFNPLGVFLMLSYPLQAWGMVALLRALGVKSRAVLFVGAAFALVTPAWIARQFGHIALSGHWVVLFALALSVSAARFGLTAKRIAAFAGLAALATGVHAYHLVPVAACFGAALLSELAQGRHGAWRRAPLAAVVVLLAVAGSAALLGYDVGMGASGGAAVLGFYAMNLLGPVWPQASNIFGQDWNGSWFAHTLVTNGEYFEGFQFQGVGTLVLLAVALGLWVKDGWSRRPSGMDWARWSPLALAMLALTAWAVGWIVYAGPWHLFDVPKPSGKLAELLSIYRAHGRFFWAPGYLLAALAISRMERLSPRIGLSVLVAVLLVQVYDTSPLREGVRVTFSAPDEAMTPKGLSTSPAVRGRPWVFRPTYFCILNHGDKGAFSQMALVALRTGGALNTFATARAGEAAACDVVDPEITRDAAPGDRRITVVFSDGKLEGGPLQPVSKRTDCHRFARGVICGRDLDGVEGLTPVAPSELSRVFRIVQSIRLDQPPKPTALLSGWSNLDPGGKGIWTDGRKAEFQIDAPKDVGPQGFAIEVVAIAFSDAPLRPQHATLYADGRALGSHKVGVENFYNYRFVVPAQAAKPGQPMRFVFDLPDARATRQDPRVLGIAVQEIRVLQ